jgi:hypothetical protein
MAVSILLCLVQRLLVYIFFPSKSLIPPSIYVDTCEPGRQCREGTGLYRGLGPGAESGQMG